MHRRSRNSIALWRLCKGAEEARRTFSVARRRRSQNRKAGKARLTLLAQGRLRIERAAASTAVVGFPLATPL